jgi:uncharacterized protein with NRDE domain
VCTLIALYRKIPGRWLVVAANRDEYMDRPSEEPALRAGREIPWLAPMDIRAGGTWLGLSQEGVFSALTNLREPNPDPTRQSRGHVVMDSLQARSAQEAIGRLMSIEPGIHNPFNAFVADRESAYLVTYRDEPRFQEIEPGVHVVGNSDPLEAGLGKGAPSKVDRVREQANEIAELPVAEVVDGLAGLCRSHGAKDSPLDDVCVHVGDSYGTRSSILMELPESASTASAAGKKSIGGSGNKASFEGRIEGQGGGGRLLYAAGPPCMAPFEDYSSLLNELRQAPGYASSEYE